VITTNIIRTKTKVTWQSLSSIRANVLPKSHQSNHQSRKICKQTIHDLLSNMTGNHVNKQMGQKTQEFTKL